MDKHKPGIEDPVDRTEWQPYRKRTIRARQLTEPQESPTGIGKVYGKPGDYHIRWPNGDEGIMDEVNFERAYKLICTKTEEEDGD